MKIRSKLAVLLLLVPLCLMGCQKNGESSDTKDIAESPITVATEHADIDESTALPTEETINPTDESQPIVNLPERLYVTTKNHYAKYLRHDFYVEKPTDFEIEVVTDEGSMSLGIKHKDKKDYVLESKEYTSGTETDSVSLEKGWYSVVIEAKNHAGSYEVKGQ